MYFLVLRDRETYVRAFYWEAKKGVSAPNNLTSDLAGY